jgi:hypothetical protein
MKPISNSILLAMACMLMAFIPGDSSRSEYNVPINATAVAAGDIDFDGDNDIVVGCTFSFQSNWGGLSILKKGSRLVNEQ